jgi:hypothetical protein
LEIAWQQKTRSGPVSEIEAIVLHGRNGNNFERPSIDSTALDCGHQLHDVQQRGRCPGIRPLLYTTLDWSATSLGRRDCPEMAPTVNFSSRKNCFGYERKSSRPLPNRSSKIGRSLSPEQATSGGTFPRKAMLFCGSKLPHLSVNSLFLLWY